MFYLFFLVFFGTAIAEHPVEIKTHLINQQPSLTSSTYALYDPDSKTMLVTQNGDEKRPIASLTKLMSLYVVSDALQNNFIKLNDPVKISRHAARMTGSKMFTNEGSSISVDQLINGAIITSGNDSTMALAEHIAGNESSFVAIMNDFAKRIQLNDSHFSNATGLIDKDNYSTANDLAHLSAHIIQDFPKEYTRYHQKEMRFNGIKQKNRNRLLTSNKSVDGLKTGYTKLAGYCLAASELHHPMRLIAIVLGAPNESIRSQDAQALLNYGFRFFKQGIIKPKTVFGQVKVWYGSAPAKIGVLDKLVYNQPRFTKEPVKAEYKLTVKQLVAPISAGTVVGTLSIKQGDQILKTAQLQVVDGIKEKNVFFRFFDWIHLTFNKLLHRSLV